MSTIKSSSEHLTLNADGASKDIKFQANGVEKASISSAGAFTSTTIDATALTGALPAISAASLTNVPAANITGTLPAIDGSNLTGMSGGKVLQVVGSSSPSSYSTTTSSSWVEHASLAITPSSSSSKIVVMMSGYVGMTRAGDQLSSKNKLSRIVSGGSEVILTGASTAYSNTEYISFYFRYNSSGSTNRMGAPISYNTYDAPSTTSEVTYKIYFVQTDTESIMGGVEFILMEIAG